MFIKNISSIEFENKNRNRKEQYLQRLKKASKVIENKFRLACPRRFVIFLRNKRGKSNYSKVPNEFKISKLVNNITSKEYKAKGSIA